MNTTEILIKVRKIIRSIDIESKKIQKEHGVSIPQLLCLNFLQKTPTFQSTQGEVRKFLNLNPSTVSGIIDRLENKGFVARLPNPHDKRMAIVALTAAGDKLLKNIPSLLHERLSSKLDGLNEKELIKIWDGLDTLIHLLEIEQIEASPLIALNIECEDIL